MTQDHGQEAFRLGADCTAVVAELSVGPRAGMTVVSISTTPGDIDDLITKFRADTPRANERLAAGVISTIRAVVDTQQIVSMSPEADDDFLNDLRLLAALRVVLGDGLLAKAGIARMVLIGPGQPQPVGDWPPFRLQGET